MMLHNPSRRALGIVGASVLALLLVLPGTVAAHSELVSSTPAEGATVAAGFSGPIVLTFSEELASGSKADLVAPDGSTVAAATVDGPGKTMTFTLTALLPAGAYQVKWTSIADDGDVLRLPIVHFMVAAGASPATSPSPVASASAATSAAPSAIATANQSPVATTGPSASPSPGSDTSGSSTSDVLLPIIVALIVLGAGAAYLLNRRNRPTPPTSPTPPA